jgi:uncharacterized repeat protein (TIGR04076 family)
MQLEPTRRVQIKVVRSECPLMKEGESVYLNGAVLDNERSGQVCVTALTGIYPWIMAARFGVESKNLGYDGGYRVSCQDKLVDFLILDTGGLEDR